MSCRTAVCYVARCWLSFLVRPCVCVGHDKVVFSSSTARRAVRPHETPRGRRMTCVRGDATTTAVALLVYVHRMQPLLVHVLWSLLFVLLTATSSAACYTAESSVHLRESTYDTISSSAGDCRRAYYVMLTEY